MTNKQNKFKRSCFNADYAKFIPIKTKINKKTFLIVIIIPIFLIILDFYMRNFVFPNKSIETIPLQLKQPENLVAKEEEPIISAQLEDPYSELPAQNWRMEKVFVEPNDSLSSIFKKLHIPRKDLHEITNGSLDKTLFNVLYPGQELIFSLDESNNLQKLKINAKNFSHLEITREQEGFKAEKIQKSIDIATNFANGTIKSSLYEAGINAGLSDRLIAELAILFGWDIDFAFDIRINDSFAVMYETKFVDGEQVADGDILAAKFTNQDKTYYAIRYTDKNGNTDYYNLDGRSIRKAFIRTPVNFTRISSYFSTGRHHPILHKIRAHKGVDYAAPKGTPVKAAGDGKIIFRGKKGGYGNTIIIQHGHRYKTLYAHLNNFKSGQRIGSAVNQGQIIGFVGSTGLATGPHLHYEFHVDDQHRNPLTVALPKAKPITVSDHENFLQYATHTVDLINRHENTPPIYAENKE